MSVSSPNFAFLKQHDLLLVRYAAFAERYVFEDPNSSLVKLRQFGELLAQHLAAYAGVEIGDRESQQGLLSKLWDAGVLNSQVSQLFHGIRTAGNDATHSHANDRSTALHQLQMARKLAVWFHKSFGKDKNFKAGPFIPPPNPVDVEEALRAELDRLRVSQANHLAEMENLKLAAVETEHERDQLAEESKLAYQELEAALELAAESERQLEAERQLFRQRMAELEANIAAQPIETRNATVSMARQYADDVDLDEIETRRLIDGQLRAAGWEADSDRMRYAAGFRPSKGRNTAIAEWPTRNGPADYVLFVGLRPIAIVEAKRQRRDVASAIEQAKRYSKGYELSEGQELNGGPWDGYQIPFLFSTNGRPFLRQIAEKSGIWFLDARRPVNHSHAIVDWYSPEGLDALSKLDIDKADERLATDALDYLPLRKYQAEAIAEIEEHLAEGQRDLLVAMATGTGKTITCIALIYRLIKAGRFRRILFLVDRSSLGEQAVDKLKDVRLENLQTFADIYDVKELGDLKPDKDTKLHFATVQGMVKRLLYAADDAPPIPVDWYDCIVIDECHRGYNLDQEMTEGEMEYRNQADYISKYRRVIDHFDAVRIGLTATPALHTTEIFGQPVFQYSYRQAVIDGFLVDHEPPFRLLTRLSEDGIRWEQGDDVHYLDSRTNQLQLFNTPDEIQLEVDSFNRKVLTDSFNQTVCQALADQIDPTIPGKTIVFCVDDLHADKVVRFLKEAFDDAYGGVHEDYRQSRQTFRTYPAIQE